MAHNGPTTAAQTPLDINAKLAGIAESADAAPAGEIALELWLTIDGQGPGPLTRLRLRMTAAEKRNLAVLLNEIG